jgi:hypothetical protein
MIAAFAQYLLLFFVNVNVFGVNDIIITAA